MKKVSLLALGLFSVGVANAASYPSYQANLTQKAQQPKQNIEWNKYNASNQTVAGSAYAVQEPTRGGANMYYTPSSIYDDYDGCKTSNCETTVKAKNYRDKTTTTTTKNREKTLLHPFFMPGEGAFVSSTEAAFHKYDLDFKVGAILDPLDNPLLVNGNPAVVGDVAEWRGKSLDITQEFGVGITDNFAIFVVGLYHDSDYKFIGLKESDSGLDDYGVGVTYRPYEDSKIVTRTSLMYTKQDASSQFVLDGRVGYKMQMSTLYAAADVYIAMYDDEERGIGVVNPADAAQYIIVLEDGKNHVYVEGTVGVFTAFGNGLSLDLSTAIGDFGWHQKWGARADLGYQFNKYVALDVFGSMVLWDSGDGDNMTLERVYQGVRKQLYTGKIDNSSEYNVGVGLKIYF